MGTKRTGTRRLQWAMLWMNIFECIGLKNEWYKNYTIKLIKWKLCLQNSWLNVRLLLLLGNLPTE